ncbi:MAG: START domain-containing protein [Polyangia bacterium]
MTGYALAIVIAIVVIAVVAGLALLARQRRQPKLPRIADIDPRSLRKRLESDLALSAAWPASREASGVRVSSGWLPKRPVKAYRSDVLLDGSLEDVVRFLADDQVARLGEWNSEFSRGEMPVLSDSLRHRSWLARVSYSTPPIMKDREYLYYLSAEQVRDDEVLIAYWSVEDDRAPWPGHHRAVLYPTVHRCTRVGAERTRVEHILVNDLCGAIPVTVQNRLFRGKFLAANLRDSLAQQRLFPVR